MRKHFFEASEGAILSLTPDSFLASYGQRTWTDMPLEPSWYFPDFFLERRPCYFQQEKTEKVELDLPVLNRSSQIFEWKLHGLERFERAFSELGDIKKAVPYLSYRAKGRIDPGKLIMSALHYLKKNSGTHLYGYWSQNEGMIGVTPELLFECSDGILRTQAVAGTAPFNERALLQKDPKLKEEHHLVIQGIRNSLQAFGVLDVGSTEIHSFGKLAHLVTPISLFMNQTLAFESCVHALHPTPALGTFPKERGSKWLKDYADELPRGRFGAPVGYCNPIDRMGKCVVAIRNIQWQKDRLEILCGCGITEKSSFQAEKDEIALKFESIKEIFQL